MRAPMRSTIASSTSVPNAVNTPRTSTMWARSRSVKTGDPSTVWAKLGGPTTRSDRTLSVTLSTWAGV